MPSAPKETARREERSLKQLWDLLVSGPAAARRKEQGHLPPRDGRDRRVPGAARTPDVARVRAQAQRANLTPDVVRRSRRVAAVLVEPIQGEGGVRMASARFMRKLRLLTRIYDVPLIFDEVQTGWGMTGRLWAHELFDLPCPPDLVTWAKKAQNGVLFVSEALATFFQEEKKFNTTWEGDSVGMVRLLALLDKLDLEQVRRTGERARSGLEALARDYSEIVKNVRGAGVMLGFDVQRADLCDALLDRAFRRGLVLLPAGERTLRFYPRYDTEPSAIDEALSILRLAIEDLVGGRGAADATPALKIRVGTLAIPLDTVELVDLTPASFDTHKLQIADVEQERYGASAQYPPDVLRAGPPAAAAVSDRDARGDDGQPARDRHRAARSRVGTPRRLRARQRAREPRRGRRRLDPRFGENNTLLPAGDGDAADGAERGRARELPARRAARARDRRRIRRSSRRSSRTGCARRVRTGCATRSVLERIDNYLRSGSRSCTCRRRCASRRLGD